MNKATLDKLKSNPFYKPNASERMAMAEAERKDMVEFGVPSVHNDSFAKHSVEVRKYKRKEKSYNGQIE